MWFDKTFWFSRFVIHPSTIDTFKWPCGNLLEANFEISVKLKYLICVFCSNLNLLPINSRVKPVLQRTDCRLFRKIALKLHNSSVSQSFVCFFHVFLHCGLTLADAGIAFSFPTAVKCSETLQKQNKQQKQMCIAIATVHKSLFPYLLNLTPRTAWLFRNPTPSIFLSLFFVTHNQISQIQGKKTR